MGFGKEWRKNVGINRAACEKELQEYHQHVVGEAHCAVGQSLNSVSKILNKRVGVGGLTKRGKV